MAATGDRSSRTAFRDIVCRSCGEPYETQATLGAVLRNGGFCVNLTCLADLSDQRIEEAYDRCDRNERREPGRRETDRRAV